MTHTEFRRRWALRLAVRRFLDEQSHLENFGATDTEPRDYFWSLVARAWRNEDSRITNSPGYPGWSLYSSMPRSEEAAARLTAAAQDVLSSIRPYDLGDAIVLRWWLGEHRF